MATGQSLSDEKLLTCIDGALKSDAFPKFAVTESSDDKPGAVLDILNTSDVDAYRFWESISKETSKTEVPALPEAIETTPTEGQTPPVTESQPKEPASSAHYPPKRRNASQQEIWDVDDEYHDDEDPGYRIREIYEAELLAELSQKLGSTKSETPAADELTSAAAAEQGDAPAETAANPQSPEPGSDSGEKAGEDAVSEALGATPQGGSEREPRSASPTFGGAPPDDAAEDTAVSGPPDAEGEGSPLNSGTPRTDVLLKPVKSHDSGP
ncbi:unnamed protein product [Symbiodinium natans]|uniref:Uncharacterized protein n=1 Tax=Symbiodinium natans TaxID=878477 RepID=A0A812MYC4_9DINO|nr:unnamed protein product [Symbiodinium natans]